MSGLKVIDGTPDSISGYLREKEKAIGNKELKRILTDFAAGHITKKQKDDALKDIKVAEDKPDGETEGKEEIAPINSKKGKKQRNKAREKLSKEAEEEETQIKSKGRLK